MQKPDFASVLNNNRFPPWGHIQMRKIIVGALLMSAMATSAFAQNSATQSTTSTTKIIRPIQLAKNSDLAFGTIVRPSSGSNTVAINEDTGARALSGGGNAAVVGGGETRATFTVTGEGAQTFAITVPDDMTMNRVGGGGSITVALVETDTTGTLDNALGAAGSATFGVGGSFTVSDATATGDYSGTFDVTVAYN